MGEILLFVCVLIMLTYSVFIVWRRMREPEASGELDLSASMPRMPGPVGRFLNIVGIELEPLLFIAGLVLSAVAVSLVFLTLFPDKVTLAILAGVAFLPASLFLFRDITLWRAQVFEWGLVDVLELMSALVASGVNPLESIESSAKGAPRIVRDPLMNIVMRIRLGDTIENATRPLLSLHKTEGSRLFVMTLRSRWEEGVHFQSLLRTLTTALRQRRTFAKDVTGQLSGAKYALLMVAALPYLLIPFFYWKEPDWLLPLTEHPSGPVLLFIAILCQVVGILWMRLILRSQTW